MSKRIIIIGGGPAGIEAARAAVSAGAEVILVSEGPLGGRSGWSSLLPSKVWLSAADIAGLIADSPFSSTQIPPSPDVILPHLQNVKTRWNNQQEAELKALDVSIVPGLASLKTSNSITVKDDKGLLVSDLSGDAIILATGSVPFFPPNLKPDGKKIIAPRMLSGLEELPASIAVVGAGATGTEVVYLFNRLGIEVTWIIDKWGVLPSFAPTAGELLANILVRRGVNLLRIDSADHFEYEGNKVTLVMSDGQRKTTSMIFLAIGRYPDIKRLNLETAGLSLVDGRFPLTDPFCQTSVPGIYAVGDAAGPPMVANRAMAMARVAALHAAGIDAKPFNPNSVITAVYSEPQIAQVGLLPSDDETIQTKRIPFHAVMKSHFLPEMEGIVELAYNPTGKVTGGLAVGPHAADILAPVALAVQLEATLDDIAAVFAGHPTLSELTFAAARQ